jgi:hypothetical protein
MGSNISLEEVLFSTQTEKKMQQKLFKNSKNFFVNHTVLEPLALFVALN